MHIEFPAGIPVIALLNTTAPYDIPLAAREWGIVVLTGTCSITCNGATAAGLPAGFSDGSPNTILKKITITPAAASTVYVRYLPKG